MNVRLNVALGFRTGWGGSKGCIMHRVPTSCLSVHASRCRSWFQDQDERIGPRRTNKTRGCYCGRVVAPCLIKWFFFFFFFFFFSPISGKLPRVNTRVFFFFFFRLFSTGCPGLIPRVFFCFFFRPFLAGCPGLIPGFFFFFFFFRPFPAGCPGLIPRFFFFFLFFPPFSDGLPRVNSRICYKKKEEGIRLQIFRFFGGWVWSEGKKQKGGTGELCPTITGTH